MKIFSRQTIFFCVVVCANKFFSGLHLPADNFLCVQPVASVGYNNNDDDDDNNYYYYFLAKRGL